MDREAFRRLREKEMHRDIRFRAWNKEWKKMSLCGVRPDGKPHWFDIRGGTSYVEESILMQFTGIHDKRGREIWQDDIIQDSAGKACVVKWHKCIGGWDAWDESIMKFLGKARNWNPHNWPDAVEVVGNIYEAGR